MIGKLDTRAALSRKTQDDDGGGGYVESWKVFATAWVSLEAVGGDDAYGPDAPESRGKYRIVLRRRADIAAGDRVVIGMRCFDVAVTEDDGARVPTMTLICEEVP